MTTLTQEHAILAWNNCNEALNALTALRVTYKHGVKIEPFDLDITLRANDGETSESRKFSLTWA